MVAAGGNPSGGRGSFPCAWCHKRHRAGTNCPVKTREMTPRKGRGPRPLFPRKSKGRLENTVQAGILAYLSTRKDIVFWRSNTGAAKFGNSYVQFGLKGAADIQGIQAVKVPGVRDFEGKWVMIGRFFGVEAKRQRGGKVSKDQRIWGQNVVNFGGLYIVAPELDPVIVGLGPEQYRIDRIPYIERIYPT